MNDDYPELIFGLVGAIGTNLELVADSLTECLEATGYSVETIKLSLLMRDLNAPWSDIPPRDDPKYYDAAMTAGNNLRASLNRNDAMAGLGIARIKALRGRNQASTSPSLKRAYIIISLKRTEEMKLLRGIYGPAFFVISAYSPRAGRVDRLAAQLAKRQHKNQSNALRSEAETLIVRDENERLPNGQDVRKVYPLANLFVRTSSAAETRAAIQRFVALIFGDMWRTPSKDEQGMMLAYTASFRSASPARQVGAALTRSNGMVLSIGTNEVPRARGGQYWEGDSDDGRDYTYDSHDTSDKMRTNLLTDVLDKLRDLKLLSNDCPSTTDLLTRGSTSLETLREAQLFDTIDFIRAVHAEMSALLASVGATEGTTMYVTTFPCHECARHLVAAGVKRVVYVESYPKSLVSEMFRDSIAVDSDDECEGKVHFVPFQGIAPSMYSQMFSAAQKDARKDIDGTITKWTPSQSFPHLSVQYSIRANNMAETEKLDEFIRQLTAKGIADEPRN